MSSISEFAIFLMNVLVRPNIPIIGAGYSFVALTRYGC
jgi:hypothetical protein